jgi:hypothetical protein
MNNTIEYKGYIGSVEFSAEDQVFYGKVQGIRSLISYLSTTNKAMLLCICKRYWNSPLMKSSKL